MAMVSVWFAALWVGCTSAPEPGSMVLVVSWDTTRADALGAYARQTHWRGDRDGGAPPVARTPTADRLAREGVRFGWAFAHAPTTLNSHVSIFTGRDPHGHHVPRNGFPMPQGMPTVATRLSGAYVYYA